MNIIIFRKDGIYLFKVKKCQFFSFLFENIGGILNFSTLSKKKFYVESPYDLYHRNIPFCSIFKKPAYGNVAVIGKHGCGPRGLTKAQVQEIEKKIVNIGFVLHKK